MTTLDPDTLEKYPLLDLTGNQDYATSCSPGRANPRCSYPTRKGSNRVLDQYALLFTLLEA